jgi:hypothetical protein
MRLERVTPSETRASEARFTENGPEKPQRNRNGDPGATVRNSGRLATAGLVASLLAFIAVSCVAQPLVWLLALAPAGSRRLRLAWRIADRLSTWGHALCDEDELENGP